MTEFEAPGAVVKRAWLWLVVPFAVFAYGWWLVLLERASFGVIVQSSAAVVIAIGFLKHPRRRTHATIAIRDRVLFAGKERIAALDEIAGVSIVDGMLSVTTHDERVTHLFFEERATTTELRAALGLALAPSASRRFSGYIEANPLVALGIMVVSIAVLGVAFVKLPGQSLAAEAFAVTFALVVMPVVLSHERRVTVTCGTEGIHVANAVRDIFLAWSSWSGLEARTDGRVILRFDPRLCIELPSREDAEALVMLARERSGQPTDATGDRAVEAILARGTRDLATWQSDIAGLARVARDAYRSAGIDDGRLWTTLEDPRADPTARIAAGQVLRIRVGTAARARLLHVAASTSFPELRVALTS